MPTIQDVKTVPGLSAEMSKELISALDVFSAWRDEIDSANERYLRKALNQTSTIAQSMGWPEPAIRSLQQHLQGIATVQREMLDRLVEGWKQQLKTTGAPGAFSQGIVDQISSRAGAWPDRHDASMMGPWAFWMQAAEMWQKAWMPDMTRHDRRGH